MATASQVKVLVDTPVWIDHLHRDDAMLRRLLAAGAVYVANAILGELAAGNLPNRLRTMSDLRLMPRFARSRRRSCARLDRGTSTRRPRVVMDRLSPARHCRTEQRHHLHARSGFGAACRKIQGRLPRIIWRLYSLTPSVPHRPALYRERISKINLSVASGASRC